MKPNFALNITDSHLALLHRTSRGWMPVGEVAFDSPDLDEAIGYLRASALGLSPQGMTTKLVLPRSQILYTEVEAPGPDKASRRAQIVKALEGRTPYAPEELVFDWWGKGDTVQVAVVARETLEEAEAFAETHRLNPVSFVTIPDDPAFAGEPWFGASKLSTKLLPEGEKVTRDQDPVVILSRDKADAKAESQTKADKTPDEENAPSEGGETAPDSADAKAEAAIREAEAAARAEAEAEAAAAKARAEAEAEALRVAERLAAERAEADRLRAEAAARDAAEEAARKAAEALSEKAATPTFASRRRDDRRTEPPLSAKAEAATETTPKDQSSPAGAPAAGEPAPSEPKRDEPALNISAPDEHPANSGAVTAEKAAATSVNPSPKAENDAAAPTKSEPNKSEPPKSEPPAAGETASPHSKTEPTAAAIPPLAAPKPAVTEAAPKVNGAAPADKNPELPTPAKSPASAIAAGGKEDGRNPPADLAKGPALRPDAPAPSKGPMVRIIPQGAVSEGKSSSPFAGPVPVARPASATPPQMTSPAAPKPAAKGASPAKRLAAMVTAAKIPGRSNADSARKPSAAPDRAASTTLPGGSTATASGSGIGSFGERVQRQRGKPRYLGLALTGILLIVLALIAAWSSVYLSSNETDSPDALRNAAVPAEVAPVEAPAPAVAALPEEETTEVAGTAEAPAAEDLAAAENAPAEVLPDEAAEIDAAAALEAALVEAAEGADETPPAEPEFRPDMAGTAEPTARGAPSADTQDEIFLAAMDGPAPTFDAVALPRPETTPDAAPQAAAPPPPAGTRYEFEPDGTIRAGETGVVTPEGFWLIAARPPVLPPARPADAPAEVVEAPADAAPLATAEAPERTEAAEATGTESDFAPSAEVTQRRPEPRPANAETPATEAEQAEDDAALAPATDSRLASLRPRLRPETLAAAATARRQTAEAASLAATATAEGATASTAALPVAISLRPAARPRDFSRAVAAAVAAATQSAAASSQRRSAPVDAEEEDEPQVVASAAPRIPTRASVAKQATFTNAINLSKINLIGVYGTANNRYALVRSPNGRYTKVKVGDRVDGGVVAAITSNELRYQKGGRMLSLAMPRG